VKRVSRKEKDSFSRDAQQADLIASLPLLRPEPPEPTPVTGYECSLERGAQLSSGCTGCIHLRRLSTSPSLKLPSPENLTFTYSIEAPSSRSADFPNGWPSLLPRPLSTYDESATNEKSSGT